MHKLAMIPTMYMTLRLPGIISMPERIFIIVLYRVQVIFHIFTVYYIPLIAFSAFYMSQIHQRDDYSEFPDFYFYSSFPSVSVSGKLISILSSERILNPSYILAPFQIGVPLQTVIQAYLILFYI